jgi:tetratricopeptide (TPR) repeat protein
MFDGYESVTVTGKLLKNIVRDYSDVLSEPGRFEGLLKDIYGSENKKEIFLLATALKARITDIRECNIVTNDTESKIYKMISRLSSDYGLDEKSAAWVTIAWAIGFDLMAEVEDDNLANGIGAEKYVMLGNFVANMDENIQHREIPKCNPISNLITMHATDLKQLYENGMILHNQGKFAEALEYYDKALAIAPQNSNVLSNKGLSLHNQGKFAEALEYYDKALAIAPKDEFIIKRRNNTREILINSGSNMGSGQVIGQVSNLNNGLKKSINLYFLGIVIAAVFVITGIAAYMIFGTGSILEEYPPGNNSQLISDASMNNIYLTNEGSESPSITPHKESILDFANNIEKQLNLQTNSENQSLFQSVNESWSSSNSGNSQSNDIEIDSLNGVNQKVDNFKTELGKAMKSNFS